MKKNSVSIRETLPRIGAVMGAVRMSAGGANVTDKLEGNSILMHCVVTVYMSM